MAKSRLMLLSLKDIIYTLIFIVIAIIFAILLFCIILPSTKGSSKPEAEESVYTPGKYTSCFSINNNNMSIELTVDKNCVNSVEILDMDDTVMASYPLIPSCAKNIEKQLQEGIDINELKSEPGSEYTQLMLTHVIKGILEKAYVR